MLTLTPAGAATLDTLFDDHQGPLRLNLATGGCGIQFLTLSPGRIQVGLQMVELGPYGFQIDPDLLLTYAPIRIDSDGIGLLLSGSGITPPYGCGTCPFGCAARGAQIQCPGDCSTCATPCLAGRRRMRRHTPRCI